jgi:hypothetical protein
MRNHDTQPTVGEINLLIRKLAAYRPLADFFRVMGINPKTDDAKLLCAYALAHLVLGVKKLPRREPTKSKWTIAHDVALQAKVIRLQRDERLSARAALAKIATSWDFPYASRTNKHSPKYPPQKQREAALRKRWTDLQARLKLVEQEMSIWARALGSPSGETRCQDPGFQFTNSAMHSVSIDSNFGAH